MNTDPIQLVNSMPEYGPQNDGSAPPDNNYPLSTSPQLVQAQQSIMPQVHKGNFFTHLMPTAGSILGGLISLPAEALNLVAPGGGTALNMAGAVAGGGIGKAAENAAEGNNIGSGVAANALESGVGAGVGGLIGKGVGAASKLAGGFAKGALDKTATQAAIDNRALSTKDIPNDLQALYKANDSLDHVQGLGFDSNNPTHVTQVADTSNDILNSVLDKGLASSGPVDLSNYPQIVKDALAKESGTLGSYEPVAISRGRLGTANTPAAKLLAQLESLGSAPGETTGTAIAKANADPNELRTLTTKLNQLAQDAKPTVTAKTGAIDPVQRATYNALNDIRGNVKDALYNRPEVNDALKGELSNIAPEDALGSQQLADHLNNVIGTAGQNDNTPAQDLLSEISNNINVKNIGQEMGRVNQIASSTGAQARAANDAGIVNGNTNSVLDALHGSTSGAPKSVTGMAVGALTHTIKNPKILGPLARIGELRSKLAPAAGAGIGDANANLQSGNGTVGGSYMQPDNTQQSVVGSAMSPTQGLTRDDLITLALYSPSAFQSLVMPSAGQQQQVVAANTAENALGGLGQAPGGGILSSLAGRFGFGPTGEYQRKAQNAAQQIAAAMPGSDAGTVARELTDYNAGSGNIQATIQHLLANLEATKQNNTNSSYQSLMNYNPSILPQAQN